MAATKTQSPADKLKALRQQAKPKPEPKPSKKELRVIDMTGTDNQKEVGTLCELAHLGNQFSPLIEQHKNAVEDIFFERWTAEMWDKRNKPENFKAKVKKLDAAGKPLPLDDMACNFVMKFRADGLKKKLPKEADLPDGKTMHEVLVETLMSGVVGMSEVNAEKFVTDEIEFIEVIDLAKSFNELLAADEGTPLRDIGERLFQYLTARPNAKSKKTTVELPAFTDELQAEALVMEQTVRIKDGVEERVFGYCESLDQLRKLLKFLSCTTQVSNFEFGISDEVADRNKRLTEIAGRYINLASEAA